MLTIILKVTDGCNLRCPYCYNFSNLKETRLFNIKNISKILFYAYEVLQKQSDDNLTLIFHGGEPTLADLNWYKKALEIIKEFEATHQINITCCMQTNFTKQDKELFEFLILNNVQIGTSFDGPENSKTRDKFNLYLKNKALYEKYNIGNSCINIITNQNINKIFEMGEWYIKNNFHNVELHEAYKTKTISQNNIDIVNIKQWIEMLKLLYQDIFLNYESHPFETNFSDWLSILNGDTNSCKCEYKNCRNKWICIHPNGDYTPCGQEWNQNHDFVLGNIQTVSILEVFSSEKYNSLFDNLITEECKKCPLKSFCNGGCIAKRIANTGQYIHPDPDWCLLLKEMIKWIYHYNKENFYKIKNLYFKNYILNGDYYE